MPDNVTRERRQLVALFGAEVIDSPGRARLQRGDRPGQAPGRQGPALRDALPVRQPGQPPRPRGDDRPGDPADCPELDVFVAGLGTGGTLMGVGRFLRRAKPGVRIVAAEPLPGETVQGLRSLDDGFVPEVFDPTCSTAKYLVTNRDADRRRCASCSIARGSSPGRRPAPSSSPRRAWRATMEAGTIVALLPDGGWKYLSAGTFDRDLDELEDATRGRRQLVVSGDSPARRPASGPGCPGLRRDPRRRSSTTPGARSRTRPAGDRGRADGRGRRPRAPLGAAPQRGGLALPLRDRPGATCSALTIETDDADEVVLGDRPFPRRLAGAPVADRPRAGALPGRAVPPRLARPAEADPGTGGRASRAWRIVDGGVTRSRWARRDDRPGRRLYWRLALGLRRSCRYGVRWNAQRHRRSPPWPTHPCRRGGQEARTSSAALRVSRENIAISSASPRRNRNAPGGPRGRLGRGSPRGHRPAR